MADKIASLGQTGMTVLENIKRFREERKLSYVELASALASAGRPIPPLGLSRIESGERRVDTDDLMALAIALQVNTNALLLPEHARADTAVVVTGTNNAYSALQLWEWANGVHQLPLMGDASSRAAAARESLRNLIFQHELPTPGD